MFLWSIPCKRLISKDISTILRSNTFRWWHRNFSNLLIIMNHYRSPLIYSLQSACWFSQLLQLWSVPLDHFERWRQKPPLSVWSGYNWIISIGATIRTIDETLHNHYHWPGKWNMKLPINTPPMKNDTHISHRCQTHPISPAEDLATNGRHIFGACTLVIHVYLDKPIWIHRNGEHLASCENPRTKLNSSSRTAILFTAFPSVATGVPRLQSATFI